MVPEKIVITPTYKKDNGVWVLNTQTIVFPQRFQIVEQSIVYIPPHQYGGNHKHPRVECFIGIGNNLELWWQDEQGRTNKELMNDSNLCLFLMPSYVPHLVYNGSSEHSAILYEYANDKQHDVVTASLI